MESERREEFHSVKKTGKAIAIITARGGSKRIPKKNIRDFCEKPIIAYSIEAAVSAGCFDEVMVSTDSETIADLSRSYGAAVPFLRGAETSSDYATTADVLTEVLQEYRRLGTEFETLCCLYPTAPFVTAEKLRAAVRVFSEGNADCLFPVVPFGFPPQRGMVIRDNRLCYVCPEHERTRSQDLEPLYHDCGQFYICKVKPFLERHTLVLPNTIPFILPEEEVQDIDNLSDWRLAEIKYRMFLQKDSD